jgi:hypothetical protein
MPFTLQLRLESIGQADHYLGWPIVPANHDGLINGLIVYILLIVIVIGALVYYRRRERLLGATSAKKP